MRPAVTMMGLWACSILLCACSSESVPATNMIDTNASATAPRDEPQSPWLPRLNEPPEVYPAYTQGSPYAELLNTVITDWGKPKDEFESTADYNARINQVQRRVTDRFGRVFSFKSNRPGTGWDADRNIFRILHTGEFRTANHLVLGLEGESGGTQVMYGMNVQGCATNPTINLTSDQARRIKAGLDDQTIGLFYVGTIDFSRRGWVEEATLSNHETIPGFHMTAMQGSNGPLGVWDFDYDVIRIDIVEATSGRVLASLTCA